jgi:ferredoxin-NADP reductase
MARTALRRGLAPSWRSALLATARPATAAARSLCFRVVGWPGHLAGQHVDVRLTAEDGYTAQRSYSMAAPADGDSVEIAVQLVGDGEVSPYLVRDIDIGDEVEVLGPLGGWFVWHPEQTEPVLLIGGGSGVVPLIAMRRAHALATSAAPMRLIYSVRSRADVYFADDLLGKLDPDVVVLYTRIAPLGDARGARRINHDDLAANAWPADQQPTSYVCGPTPFVEAVITMLLASGYDTARIRAERFGATGG